jgi:hypothetical protein
MKNQIAVEEPSETATSLEEAKKLTQPHWMEEQAHRHTTHNKAKRKKKKRKKEPTK